MKTIYVSIDMQNDFVLPTGALYVPGAETIVPTVRKLLDKAHSLGSLLIGSVDSHTIHSGEFKHNGGPFPVHCLKGTQGQLIVSELQIESSLFVPKHVDRSMSRMTSLYGAIYFEKDSYGIFENDNVAPLVFDFQGYIPARVVIFGVATDYCVKEAAHGFRDLGFEVLVVEDAIKAVTEQGHLETFARFERAGIKLVQSADIL